MTLKTEMAAKISALPSQESITFENVLKNKTYTSSYLSPSRSVHKFMFVLSNQRWPWLFWTLPMTGTQWCRNRSGSPSWHWGTSSLIKSCLCARTTCSNIPRSALKHQHVLRSVLYVLSSYVVYCWTSWILYWPLWYEKHQILEDIMKSV